MPNTMTSPTPTRWADIARQGGYITPVQREAFTQAIHLVRTQLNTVLNQSGTRRQGEFEFDAFVDSLEQDFLHQADIHTQNGLHSDVAQTSFWIARLIADRFIAVRQM
ncbi:DNA-binding protein [Pectobacterium punjabense]|uniref:DNA-binding protein n=1 Tax=Pectobacterium punjabense TaxID=2108399 RepID=A0ABX6L2L5_9GAMM|nr:DNA-binding protein [Pectobacterium punjabense]MBS4431944.1 DNA-binding protein [Pectobacterium punjabense]MDG0795531.1 DNA-binding protein [Pectobacterium punjabense]PTA63922.1 DNA-binding protein [Pectobacterium punjabense]QJA20506.1 DNA-binding protein [Pectobacterium punjabense]